MELMRLQGVTDDICLMWRFRTRAVNAIKEMMDSQIFSHIMSSRSILCCSDVERVVLRKLLKQFRYSGEELGFVDAFFLVVRAVYLDGLRDLFLGKTCCKTTFKWRSHETTNGFGIRARNS